MRIQIYVLLFFTSFIVCKNDFSGIYLYKPQLLKQKKLHFCYISLVKIGNEIFLIKQKKSSKNVLCIVRDALAAYIAESLNIAHRVDIIPANKDFVGKKYQEWPATIHTIAPGITIKDSKRNLPYKNMNIKQEMLGFRRDMLRWMAQHQDIIKIVALDIFLCNHDRHRGNLFYNAKTNSFCAIDMDLLFEYNLALSAYHNVIRMEKSNLYPITHDEFFALIKLRDTLEFLVNKFHPDDTIVIFDKFIEKAGLVEGSSLYTSEIKAEIARNKSMIKQSYKDVILLIKILDDTLAKAIQKKPSLKDLLVAKRFMKK